MRGVSTVAWDVEAALWNQGYRYLAGIDEAGRGALAGPVVAAAVVLPRYIQIPGVDDSKRLRREVRESLYVRIASSAAAIGVGIVAAEVIDQINIRQATRQAMVAAIQEVSRAHPIEYLLIDGLERLPLPMTQQAFVRGDQRLGSIAAASIVAKVTRDRLMDAMDQQYPGYGLARHKGYGTVAHVRAIRLHGACAVHRHTFRGVR